MHIYVFKNGVQTGPFTEEQIGGMLTGGHVSPNDFAWHEGVSDWQPLHLVLGLIQPPPIPSYISTRHNRTASPMQAIDPTGVGGWLAFFCVLLTIFGPLSILFQLATIAEVFEKIPRGLEGSYYVCSVFDIAVCVYGFIAGCKIWSGNKEGREIAQRYLKTSLRVYSIGLMWTILAIMKSNVDIDIKIEEAFWHVLGFVIGALLFEFVIWWNYFKKSKRVRNTYGDETETNTWYQGLWENKW